MKRKNINIILLICTISLYSQQDPLSELYLNDFFYVNPSYAGVYNCKTFNITDNHQWLGIKNAPNVQILSIHGRLSYLKNSKNHHGVGGLVYRDKNGHYQNLGAQVSYAFHVLLKEHNKTYLSFGLSAWYKQQSVNQSVFRNYYNDQVITGGRFYSGNPDATIGIQLYNSDFFSGFYAANLLPLVSTFSNTVLLETNKRKYGIYLGKYYIIGNKIRTLPLLVFKTNEQLMSQTDLNLKMIFNENYWLGISYRHSIDQFPGMPLTSIIYTGLIKGLWEFSYSFSLNFNSLQVYNYGSHGLHLTYKLCTEEKGALPCPF